MSRNITYNGLEVFGNVGYFLIGNPSVIMYGGWRV